MVQVSKKPTPGPEFLPVLVPTVVQTVPPAKLMGTMSKSDAIKEYALTDSDLKKLPNTKVGARLHFQKTDVEKAAHAKHGGPNGEVWGGHP